MKLKKLLNFHRTTDWASLAQQNSQNSTNLLLQNFYQHTISDPELPISTIKFVALDFETTGLNPQKDAIISIGLVPFDLNRIYLKQAKHWLINPNRPLKKESVVIHGITHNDIVDAPDLIYVLKQVLEALAAKVVVVHCRQIEREFLNVALKARINEGIMFPMVDTLEIESYVQAKQTSTLLSRLQGAKPKSVRLGATRQRYGLPTYTPHHAQTDAIATAELLQAQIAYYYSPTTPIGKIWK